MLAGFQVHRWQAWTCTHTKPPVHELLRNIVGQKGEIIGKVFSAYGSRSPASGGAAGAWRPWRYLLFANHGLRLDFVEAVGSEDEEHGSNHDEHGKIQGRIEGGVAQQDIAHAIHTVR